MKIKTVILLSVAAVLAACAKDDVSVPDIAAPAPEQIETVIAENPITVSTSDSVKIFGDAHFSGLPATAPLILLFHQGGSNGRAEYGPIIPWLNEAGYRVIAWDQRSGGKLYGGNNRTKNGLIEGTAKGYCDAYPDLQAALDYAIDHNFADEVFIWGSSYSGALVFQLAAKNPDKISGVMAFSPASGKPLAPCLATQWIDRVKAPMLVFSPRSEMDRETTQEQKSMMDEYGVTYHITENGIHGSSMLVDDRTENDMSDGRAKVIAWLKEHS